MASQGLKQGELEPEELGEEGCKLGEKVGVERSSWVVQPRSTLELEEAQECRPEERQSSSVGPEEEEQQSSSVAQPMSKLVEPEEALGYRPVEQVEGEQECCLKRALA